MSVATSCGLRTAPTPLFPARTNVRFLHPGGLFWSTEDGGFGSSCRDLHDDPLRPLCVPDAAPLREAEPDVGHSPSSVVAASCCSPRRLSERCHVRGRLQSELQRT